jgi:ribokinase
VDARGENSIAVAGGANVALRPDQVREALAVLRPRSGDVVLVGHEIPTAAAREALRIGRDAHAITILNPAPAGSLDSATLALADILTPNRGELAALAGKAGSVDQAARALLDRLSLGAILVSLGRNGALLVEREGSTSLPAGTVEVVDTVGAGDTLNGALAAGLAEGLERSEAARRAVAAASLAVSRAGAREGMPSAAELQAVGG